ncbi:MAG: hypothetical protein ND866_18670, partial [Pyrinomonadaceae bacterium]|nr:hypothetical protein [Pyrinomonadaceae bacterium]
LNRNGKPIGTGKRLMLNFMNVSDTGALRPLEEIEVSRSAAHDFIIAAAVFNDGSTEGDDPEAVVYAARYVADWKAAAEHYSDLVAAKRASLVNDAAVKAAVKDSLVSERNGAKSPGTEDATHHFVKILENDKRPLERMQKEVNKARGNN